MFAEVRFRVRWEAPHVKSLRVIRVNLYCRASSQMIFKQYWVVALLTLHSRVMVSNHYSSKWFFPKTKLQSSESVRSTEPLQPETISPKSGTSIAAQTGDHIFYILFLFPWFRQCLYSIDLRLIYVSYCVLYCDMYISHMPGLGSLPRLVPILPFFFCEWFLPLCSLVHRRS